MPPSFPTQPPFAVHATLIHSTSPSTLSYLPNTFLVVGSSGRITHLVPNVSVNAVNSTLSSLGVPGEIPVIVLRYPKYFIIPGLIDTHVHAPQHDMRGVGSAKGMHILSWLSTLTFPHESRFANTTHARKVYTAAITSSLKQGITTACYYASLHTPATKILADICVEKGQRAFIGKVCMDNTLTNPEGYRESTSESLDGTREVIAYCKEIDPREIWLGGVVTPRFGISCTRDSLKGLGEIVEEEKEAYQAKGVLMQTHFCEAREEVDATLKQYSGFESEVDLYEKYELLSEKSVLAHCTVVTEMEIARMKELDVGIAHCPVANCTVGGGFMAAPVGRFIDEGMKVGLGTDSGGGYSGSLLDAMRMAVVVGNAREVMTGGKERRVGLEEVFWMGTKGGAKVLGLDEETGAFEVGMWFDAVVVDSSPGDEGGDLGVMTKVEEGEDRERVLEKFVMTGDDGNMVGVYVNGIRRK